MAAWETWASATATSVFLPEVMLAVVLVLVLVLIVFVQAVQSAGDWAVRRISHR